MAVIDLQLPVGFRFHPTDEELVIHYLCRKCASQPISVPIIAEIDIYNHDPWHLPKLAMYGEKEWYFFSQRQRKYPNGSRPNRAAGSGYWKATGADKPIGRPTPIGIKKALVFYSGKAPRGEKTNWIMHEYRLADSSTKNTKLDNWVLCRIYNKKGVIEQAATPEEVIKAQHSSMVSVDASDSIPTNNNYEHLLSSEVESAGKVTELDNSAFFTDEYLDYAGNIILPSSDICFMMN